MDIPEQIKKIWNVWDIRIFILLSLLTQVLLVLFAPLRRRNQHRLLVHFLWSAYLLADWVAIFALGILSNGQDASSGPGRKGDIFALWAPFLLLHLGGPDTITAFALEDNELWLRHLFGLFYQLIPACYVLLRSLPGNNLLVPTIFIFITGIVKYAERTWSLYRASSDVFSDELFRRLDPSKSYVKLMEQGLGERGNEYSTNLETMTKSDTSNNNLMVLCCADDLNNLQIIFHAYYFFHIFKRLIVCLTLTILEKNQSREFFLKRSANDAFKVMEMELSFIYEVLYTKAVVVHSRSGSRWSESVAQINLICFCLGKRSKWVGKIVDSLCFTSMLDEIQYKGHRPVCDSLKSTIMREMKKKSVSAITSESSSNRVEWDLIRSMHYESLRWSVEVEFDESILLWHIATDMCYNHITTTTHENKEREMCKLLSDYIVYLMVMRPSMTPMMGIWKIRYHDTCKEVKELFHKRDMRSRHQLGQAIDMLFGLPTDIRPAAVKGKRNKSALFDAIILANQLLELEMRWSIMICVWVEILYYVASNCRANVHAQQLSRGGELLTFVWLLMAHLGLGNFFCKEQGHKFDTA
ncbi:hypothetical protein IFM89_020712 [Coptis chinensis]|uniref:DUF4220 domain-containing protein n=1 Tax=Coptis chinensis TaxID=261450 RepID=A0A835H7N4_9MAGN|nr:hypothetical protein IFM89_020712 [Coptis chinensis]